MMIFDPDGLYMFPGAKRVPKTQRVYSENAKKCKSCRFYKDSHPPYFDCQNNKPLHIACDKYERKRKKMIPKLLSNIHFYLLFCRILHIFIICYIIYIFLKSENIIDNELLNLQL